MPEKTPKLPVRQLLILSICRFAEPVVFTSVLPYLPEMIEYVGVPREEVARWVGIASAVAATCQALMAIVWGTLSDYFGRKPIILTGLTFTMVFSLTFGSSQTLAMLLFSRALLGLMNGNVGIIRTMVAEMVPEKELQPQAFSVMPLVWTIGSIFGPAFGGALARPAEKHPDLFGDSDFFKQYPFLLPNLMSACFFVVGIATGWLFLHETLAAKKGQRDLGLQVGKMLTGSCASPRKKAYLEEEEDERTALLGHNRNSETQKPPAKRPTWGQIFSPQSSLILGVYAMMAMHNMAFDSVLPVFLHTPIQPIDGNSDVHLPFKFIGGFGIDSQTIGIFYTLLGFLGMFIQFFVFPACAKKYGVLNCMRVVSVAFPFFYLLAPFTALAPESSRRVVIFILMLGKLWCNIFAFPCCTILLTNSASSLDVLGTLNGVGTSVSAVGRALGPAIIGSLFTYGLKKGYVLIPWWALAFMGFLSAVPVFWVIETDGFQGNEDSDTEVDEERVETNGVHGGIYGATAEAPANSPARS